jgi:hypothetical protein
MVFVRQEQVVSRPGTDMLVADDGTIVTAGEVGTPDAAGYPLQIRNRTLGIQRPFGVFDPTLDRRRFEAAGDVLSMYLHRRLTPHDPSSFWVFNDSRFLLERYSLRGDLIGRYRHAMDGWYVDATRLQPSAGDFKGLALHGVQQSTAPDFIWLVYHAPRPSYVAPAAGTPFVWQKWTEDHDLIVEAWDTRRHEVIATGRFPRTEATLVRHAPDLLALIRPRGDEVYELQVVALRVVRP